MNSALKSGRLQPLDRRQWIAAAATATAILGGARKTLIGAELVKPAWPFYVMDTGLAGADVPNWEAKAKLAKGLGFRGIGVTWNPAQLGKVVDILDRHGLETSALYTVPGIEDSFDENWSEAVRILKDRPCRIELALVSRRGLKPSDAAGDEAALILIRMLLDLVIQSGEKGPFLSIYPHRDFWTERTSDGVRLAKKVNHPRFGTHFNLIHSRWIEPKRPLDAILEEAKGHLQAVTINGIANDRIVSLDQGNEDLAALLNILKKIGYQGPVGLQGYGIGGKSADHLRRSVDAWNRLS